jgi:hypothetical protein
MQNRYANILILFRFTVSSGGADFWADTKFKADYWGIFLSFQVLKPIAFSTFMMPCLAWYSAAVPNGLVQYPRFLEIPRRSSLGSEANYRAAAPHAKRGKGVIVVSAMME